MKKIFSLISMMLVMAIVCVNIPSMSVEVNAATKSKKVQILFIGNSKTISYGSPAKTFEALANNNGKNVEVTLCGEGGKTLKEIVNTKKYKDIMTKKSYDYVVMQEGIKPYLGKTTTQYNNYKYGVETIAKLVRQKNPNVKIFIRQVWVGKEYGTKNQIYGTGQATRKFYIREDEFCTTTDKNRAYGNTKKLAKSIGASVIYDGYIMGAYNNKYIKLEDNLFRKDNYHQTRYGSAVAATAIYAGIYNEMPTIKPTYFQHSLNDVFVTPEQIVRIQTIVKAKYGLK